MPLGSAGLYFPANAGETADGAAYPIEGVLRAAKAAANSLINLKNSLL